MHRHKIKFNDTTRTPRKIIFVSAVPAADGEDAIKSPGSIIFDNCSIVIARYHKGRLTGRDYHHIIEQEEFWRHVEGNLSPRNVLWIMGFELGKSMTLLKLWEQMEGGFLHLTAPALHPKKNRSNAKEPRERTGYITDDGNQFRGKLFHSEKGTIKFADVAGYTTLSATECYDNLRLVSNEVKQFAVDEETNWSPAHFDAWTAFFTVSKLISDHSEGDRGNWTPTAAGIAWHNWRHKHMSEPCYTHDDDVARFLEWHSLYGGISECRYAGVVRHKDAVYDNEALIPEGKAYPVLETAVHAYDINSAYPFHSLGMGLPTKHIASYGHVSLHEMYSLTQLWCCAALVRVDTYKRVYPVKHDGNVLYASGNYWTVLVGDELSIALEEGDIAEVCCASCWRSGMPLDAYMKHWYEMKMIHRQHGDKIGEDHIKLMMNGLIGKFAQKSGRWVCSPDTVPTKPWGQWPIINVQKGTMDVARSLGFQVQLMIGQDFMPDACPIITAVVQANLRTELRRVIRCIGPRNVLYIDTDMIHVTDIGRDNLIRQNYVSETEFGSWKYKGTAAVVLYRGRQNYNWDGKDVISGVPVNGRMIQPGLHDVRISEGVRSVINRMPDGSIRVKREIVDMRDGKYHGKQEQDGFVRPPHVIAPEFPEHLSPP